LKEDFAMSLELDKSQSSEFSEQYRLLAPLILLSFPSSTALMSVPPHTGRMSEPEWRTTAIDPFAAMTTR
jgi:hypothetical protein